MQCSNCQFENMPGVVVCGRCGTSLQLAATKIDVHPPRASRAKKAWRRWFPLISYWNRLRYSRALSAIRISGWPADLQRPGVLLRMIVPGWAQHAIGRYRRAYWMFFGYLAVLFYGLLYLGTAQGWGALGLAIAIHAAAILDIVASDVAEFRRRMLYSAAAMLMLFMLIYYPSARMLARVASPQQFNMAALPFLPGDVVLTNPSAYLRSNPRVGDVVHYQLPPGRFPFRTETNYPAVFVLQGTRIDRILAEGGQKVVCQDGKLTIDGQPSRWLPLNAERLPEKFEMIVPENSYLIFPSTLAAPAEALTVASIIPRGQILGRAYWRNQPLWRFGPIR